MPQPESDDPTKNPEPQSARWKRRLKRLLIVVIILLVVGVATIYLVPGWITGDSYDSFTLDETAVAEIRGERTSSSLTVMTANIAHGRGTSRHQMFLSKKTIEANLDNVATVFNQEQPDVIALQEADGPSIWSGRFDHLRTLARSAGYSHGLHGRHVDGFGLTYGAAILSKLPLKDPSSVTFAPSPPTMSKGFVSARIAWPKRPEVKVTIVSVHLDYARARVRSRQVARIAAELSTVKQPLIVVGDFNCEWDDRESSLRILAKELNLSFYRPGAEDMGTFPESEQRIDWILISDDLEFEKYKTLADSVSDHRFVMATIRLK